MISSTEGMCSRIKDLSARYAKVKQLQEKHKNLSPLKKKSEAVSYQKEIASHLDNFSRALGHLDMRQKGIIYISFDSYNNWHNYFYKERQNIAAGKYTTAESFKVMNEMLKLVKKIFTTIKKVTVNLEKACINYMRAADTLIAKHGRSTDKTLAAAPLKKFLTVLEQPTSDATDYFIANLFSREIYKDLANAINTNNLSVVGRIDGSVYPYIKTIAKNSNEAIKYLDKKVLIK